jgi:hypothetical protein
MPLCQGLQEPSERGLGNFAKSFGFMYRLQNGALVQEASFSSGILTRTGRTVRPVLRGEIEEQIHPVIKIPGKKARQHMAEV